MLYPTLRLMGDYLPSHRCVSAKPRTFLNEVLGLNGGPFNHIASRAPDNEPLRALRSVRVRIVSPVRHRGLAQGRVPIGRVVQGRRNVLGLYLKLKDIATDHIPCCAESSSRDMRIRDTSHPDALWMMGTIEILYATSSTKSPYWVC